VIILGIDPGTTHCGFAVIRDGVCITHGRISGVGSHARHRRIRVIGTGLRGVVERYAPDVVAMEMPFVNAKRLNNAIPMGEARGVATLVTDPLVVFDYSPSEVKQAATGKGNAKKDDVRRGVSRLFGLDIDTVTEDGADALAVAWLHWTKIRLAKKETA